MPEHFGELPRRCWIYPRLVDEFVHECSAGCHAVEMLSRFYAFLYPMHSFGLCSLGLDIWVFEVAWVDVIRCLDGFEDAAYVTQVVSGG